MMNVFNHHSSHTNTKCLIIDDICVDGSTFAYKEYKITSKAHMMMGCGFTSGTYLSRLF
jgi:hypothetical protein